jgi:Rieske Fe-S protein
VTDDRNVSLSRRSFVLTVIATAAAAGPLLAEESGTASGSMTVDVGALADYAQDGVTDTWAKTKKFLIVRESKRIVAVSSVCTHKNCVVKPKDGLLVCPCHGSRFSTQGSLQKGPGKGPLAHLGIQLIDSRIIVDPSKTFPENQWTDPASFIAIEG